MSESHAMKFVSHLYCYGLKSTGHSWQRLNSALYRAVYIAIEGGLVFGLDDFGEMLKELKGAFWFHADGPETWYAEAIRHGNRSAWKALEKFFGRKPFLFNGDRLHVGYDLLWLDQRTRVTSFDLDGRYLTACVTGLDAKTNRTLIVKRYKITRDQLKAASKPKAEAPCST